MRIKNLILLGVALLSGCGPSQQEQEVYAKKCTEIWVLEQSEKQFERDAQIRIRDPLYPPLSVQEILIRQDTEKRLREDEDWCDSYRIKWRLGK